MQKKYVANDEYFADMKGDNLLAPAFTIIDSEENLLGSKNLANLPNLPEGDNFSVPKSIFFFLRKKIDKWDGNNQNSDSLRDKAKPSSLVSSPSSRSEAGT